MNTLSEPADPKALATAYALGELSDADRTAFEQQMESDSELAELARETRDFCTLLDKNLAQPTVELQEAAKARILFEADKPRRNSIIIRHKWTRRITLAAACIAAGGTATWIWYPWQYRSSTQFEVSQSSAPDVFSSADMPFTSPPPPPVGEIRYATTAETLAKQIKEQQAKVEQARLVMNEMQKKHNIVDTVPLTPRDGKVDAHDYAEAKSSYESQLQGLNTLREHSMRSGVDEGRGLADTTVAPTTTPSLSPPLPVTATSAPAKPAMSDLASTEAGGGYGRGRGAGLGGGVGRGLGSAGGEGFREKRDFATSLAKNDTLSSEQTRGGLDIADGRRPYYFQRSSGDYETRLEEETMKLQTQLKGLLNLKGEQLIAGATELGVSNNMIQKLYPEYQAEMASLKAMRQSGYGPDHPKVRELEESIRIKNRQLEQAADGFRQNIQAQIKQLEEAKLRAAEAPGTESYKAMPENPFIKVLDARLSTFSIDVDTASYSNVRRFLNMGQCPPPEAVRLEELVNYFPYDYAAPVDGKPFAVHVEMTSAPWDETRRLARIALKGKEIHPAERPAANLVFLVDVSGSMQPENKLPLVKQSLRFVVERLTEKDTVSLVTYAGESGVALPATRGADKARIMAAIDGLGAGGSTNGAGGITTAYEQAMLHFNKEGINRVILATDGDFNVGVTSHEALLQLIEQKRKTGVFLSLLGYGMGNTKDDTMELLANKGNGNYAYIDSLSEARKALGEQFSGTLVTIAKDVKIQIEFNPAIIRSYRLLGYENRMLAAKDFKDDTKDAGEIGAGHTVTALYELVPVGAPEPQVAVDDLRYAPKPAAEPAPPVPAVPAEISGETMIVKLRWKAPDADVSTPLDVPIKDTGAKIAEASPETKWAVAVAGFAAMLNGSQFNGLTWEGIRTLAKAGKGADPHGYRGEFLQLLDRAESVRR